MNDPWDVKSVRQPGQYMSCMKINGVPLLPPLLSKECRKEMQYYKLLAKEVEKRISTLKPYVENYSESSEDNTDAPELPESELNCDLPTEDVNAAIKDNATKPTVLSEKIVDQNIDPVILPSAEECTTLTANAVVIESSDNTINNYPNFDLDLSYINENNNVISPSKNITVQTADIEFPERDYDYTKKELLMDVDTEQNNRKMSAIEDVDNVGYNINTNISDTFPDIPLNQDGPSSLTSKSFTGSLNDIHTDSMKESQKGSKLIRQRSYTLLHPSPQLLAHLEVQSLSTGVEMSCISMSESLSNLNTPNKKRRSWDLESAKVKWSSMALELKQKNLSNNVNGIRNNCTNPLPKKSQAIQPRARSVASEKIKRSSLPPKSVTKSEPAQKVSKPASPGFRSTVMNRAVAKDANPAKPPDQNKEPTSPKPSTLISGSEDPALRVRELYEKIQKQQLIQMASLVEKQKREQMLLQQVFEEQNNLLYKQLKTICPKSPIEMKEAWNDKNQEPTDRGPVSLSQLINHKSPDQSIIDSRLSSTLTNTNNYIGHCDDVLKKSRDISGTIKKQQPKSQSDNSRLSPKPNENGSRTRTHSPSHRNTSASRRLNYDTSISSVRDYEPILSDRTNDTMADLNVTFPSDSSDIYDQSNHNNTVMNHLCGQEVTVDRSPVPNPHLKSTDTAIKKMEDTIHRSISSIRNKPKYDYHPTPQQQAAATKIVAYAKGYLVRRLMKTDRVQATVQTIKDALLCALQLHQDREGIRGADVDLHRRLIQQITAACYSLHDTFISSTAVERCSLIATDRARRRSIAARQPKPFKQTDIMSQSYSGSFPSRSKRPSSASLMTQSNYETFSGDKCAAVSRSRYMPSPRRRPWR